MRSQLNALKHETTFKTMEKFPCLEGHFTYFLRFLYLFFAYFLSFSLHFFLDYFIYTVGRQFVRTNIPTYFLYHFPVFVSLGRELFLFRRLLINVVGAVRNDQAPI
jgi:hypothetical protein